MTSTRDTEKRPSGGYRSRRVAEPAQPSERGGRVYERWRGEDPTLGELLHIIWGRRWMVLGVISVFLLIAAVYTLSREPAYTAEARLAVESRNDGISGLETEGFAGSAYVEVASDDALVDEAASRSGWSAGSDEFREALDIGYFDRSGGSSGVEVGFTAAEPQMAIQAVNAYTELLAERIPATEPEGAVGTVNEVRLENRAVTASTSGGYRPVFNLLSAGLIGCVVGGGAAFLLDTRTRSWRNARDAEITLHAPVLGTIPDYEAFGTETTDGNGKKPG